ncbi:unnamed protein product [Closterium sp. NIES-64]|nr:unnamed protein product [Closterium sp. NIES-64]
MAGEETGGGVGPWAGAHDHGVPATTPEISAPMGTPTADSPTRSPTVAGAEAHAGNMADTPAASATPTAAVQSLAVAETAAAALTTLTPTPSGSGAAAAGSLAPPGHTHPNPPAAQTSPMPGMLQVGNTSSLFIQGAGPNGMRGAVTGACKDVVEQREQQPTATAAPAALEEEDRRGQAMADTDTTVTATPAAGSNDREQVTLNEGARTSAATTMQGAGQHAEEAGDTRRARAGISVLATMRLGEPLVVTSSRISDLPRACKGTDELPPNGTAPIVPPTTTLQQGRSRPDSLTPTWPGHDDTAAAAPQAQQPHQQPSDSSSSSSKGTRDEGPNRDGTRILYCPVEFDPCGGEDEAEPPEQPMSPTSQEDATPEGLKLTKREIGKAAAALMRGEQFGMKGLEAAYGLKEEEDLPTVWHRFFEDMQSMLLNTTPPEPPASSPFKSLPKPLRKAIEKELASFKSCLRTYSKVSNGLCELQQQFRDGEVSHALRISTPTLQLTDPALQESLNQALDNELKTFKTKAQLTLMGYKEKEKAHWEAAAEVWAARTHTRFESFLEKDLHFFETHAAPGTPAPDAHLKELAADYMARGMARELMYHAVWIKGNRNSKARGAAKREKARGEQAQVEQIQADPSTDLLGLMKTLVGPLQQRVEALEQRHDAREQGCTTEDTGTGTTEGTPGR